MRKVVILTAGAGSRLNERTRYFNKALLKLGDQAAISHIIDLFSPESEFIVALGHLGNIVKQYITLAHPEIRITYVDIDKFSIPGTGPAYALEKCKEHLQEPFYFVACDTIIERASFIKHHMPEVDYLVYDEIPLAETARYCTLKIENGQVVKLYDKLQEGTNKAFTGFAHIQSWQDFWQAMTSNRTCIHQELQLSPVFAKLPTVYGIQMKWHDVGSEQGLLSARHVFKGIENLDKLDEELYVLHNQVVKYFHNENIVRKRIQRTHSLEGLIPQITGFSSNFYRYGFAPGEDLFQRPDIVELLPKLLNWASAHLWTDKKDCDTKTFFDACWSFYRIKTLERLGQFYTKTNLEDAQEAINGSPSLEIAHYLYSLDWKDLCVNSIPSGFHGDFQPANIVVDSSNQFKLIDWRQDFGGIITHGDRYYDFAKLYCSFLMPHPSIKNGRYKLQRSGGEIFVDITVPKPILECRDIFESWLTNNSYSVERTRLLAAIVMLNMAALHEHPLDQWLYYYSKNLLSQISYRKPMKQNVFVLDVDGTLTDGKMVYSKNGKVYKSFGADDWNALDELKKHMRIHFISADRKGFPITQRRIEQECKYDLDLVPGAGAERWEFIRNLYAKDHWHVIYMGDGLFDGYPLTQADWGITTCDALDLVKKCANFVTTRPGGNRAVAEACLHLMDRYQISRGPNF
jgi:NDP-sugar pyrophosphorylase family protein/3-deoxy-D-manno-octulosonate 8-phosphate phosphatase KdsC-like HAD superfamily phosphatase/thiamine kinase-like enzyme